MHLPPCESHYGDPKYGCCSDEVSVTYTGVITGDWCSPECTGVQKDKCPTDVPAGSTADPQCVGPVEDPSTTQYCALQCSLASIIKDQKAADAQCGNGASCKSVSGVGICTYDD
jgi:hypothetical protein